MSDVMRESWLSLARKFLGPNPNSDVFKPFEDLERRYAEPHRFYHTLQHIERCLSVFWSFNKQTAMFPWREAAPLEMAIWYHDAVYDPHAADNEEKSTELAEKVGRHTFQLSDHTLLQIRNIILATKHRDIPVATDARVVCDVDLAGLGELPEIFDRDGENIRREYQWVPQEEFDKKRAEFLSYLLLRPRIYHMKYFQDEYELLAKQNIGRVLARNAASVRST